MLGEHPGDDVLQEMISEADLCVPRCRSSLSSILPTPCPAPLRLTTASFPKEYCFCSFPFQGPCSYVLGDICCLDTTCAPPPPI